MKKHLLGKKHVLVVEMNRGQIYWEVKKVADKPDRVFLANRYDGVFISHNDIMKVLHIVMGKGA